jgi:hypothetical protein
MLPRGTMATLLCTPCLALPLTQASKVASFAAHGGAIWDVWPLATAAAAPQQAAGACSAATCAADGTVRFWSLEDATSRQQVAAPLAAGVCHAAACSRLVAAVTLCHGMRTSCRLAPRACCAQVAPAAWVLVSCAACG